MIKNNLNNSHFNDFHNFFMIIYNGTVKLKITSDIY